MTEIWSHIFTAIIGALGALGVAYWKGKSATDSVIEEQVSARIEAVFERHEADFERYVAEIHGYQKTIDKLEAELEEVRRENKALRARLDNA